MKNSTKIQFKKREMEIMVEDSKHGVLSFPQTTKSKPYGKSNKQMQSSVLVALKRPQDERHKLSIYPEIRSKSTLGAQPMSITGMTLPLSSGQRDGLIRDHHGAGSLAHSFLHASNYPIEE